MSKKTIDEKVVSLQFDNKNFESNVATTMTTLDKLKNALHLGDAKESVDELDKSSEQLNKTVDKVKSSFSVMEVVAVTTIAKVTSSVEDFILSTTKKLTTGQIAEGWQKYADKTSAVQTIMAATKDDFEDQAKQMSFVNEQLDKLVWFTDETSYNMIDMISNISKFTSNKVKLEDAVVAMEGIALEAGLSGANTQQAARAMYNFSQAMGLGAVKVQDWMSIENATMATAEFKQMLIDTAAELKTIKKTRDGIYVTKNKKAETVSVESFRNTLASGWLTGDVLVETLKKYGNFTTELSNLYYMMEASGYTTNDILDLIKEYGDEAVTTARKQEILAEVMKASGLSAEETTKTFDKMTSAEYDLGMRAFEASQQAKTWNEALDATRDAVSSKWLGIFEIIFGNYTQAAELFTNIANEMVEVFTAPVVSLQTLLIQWDSLAHWGDVRIGDGNKYLYGRKVLLDALSTAYQNIKSIIEAVNEGFREVFPPMTGQRLFDLTVKFKELTEMLTPTEKQLDNIKMVSKGFFSILDVGLFIIKQILKIGLSIANMLRPLLNLGLDLLAFVSRIIVVGHDFITETDIIVDALGNLISVIKDGIYEFARFANEHLKISESIGEFKDNIVNSIVALKDWVNELIETNIASLESTDNMDELRAKIDMISESTKIAIDNFSEYIKTLDLFNKIKSGVSNSMEWLRETIYKIRDGIKNMFIDSADAIREAAENGDLKKAFELVVSAITGYLGYDFLRYFQATMKSINHLRESISGMFDSISGTFKSASKILDGLRESLKVMQKEVKSKIIKNIAQSVMMLAIAILILTKCGDDKAKFDTAMSAVVELTFILGTTMFALSSVTRSMLKQAITKEQVALVAAMFAGITALINSFVVVAIAIKILSTVSDPWYMIAGVVAFGIFCAVLIGVFSYLYSQVSLLSEQELTELSVLMLSISKTSDMLVKSFLKLAIALKLVDDFWTLIGGITVFGIFVLALAAFYITLADKVKKIPSQKIELIGLLFIAIGKSIKLIADAMLVISVAIKLLGMMSSDEISQGTGVMLGIIITIMVITYACVGLANKFSTLKNASETITSFGKMFLKISAGLLIMAGVIFLFGHMSTTVLTRGILAISIIIGVVVLLSALLSKLNPDKLIAFGKGMLMISVSIFALAAALFLFSLALIAIGSIGIVGMMGTMVTLKVFLEGILDVVLSYIPKVIKALVDAFNDSLEEFINGFLRFLTLLEDNLDPIIDKLANIIIILINGLTRHLPRLREALADFFTELFVQTGLFMEQEGAWQGLLTATGVFGLVAGLSKAFEMAGKIDLKTASAGILKISALVGELGGVVIAFGAVYESLNQIGSLLGAGDNAITVALEKGGEVFQLIGTAIGKFAGGIIGGFTEGVADPIIEKMPKWGTSYSEFMTNIKPFAEGAAALPDGIGTKVSDLAEGMIAIGKAEVVDGIAGFISAFMGNSDEDVMKSFKDKLCGYGVAMVEFSNIVTGKSDEVKGSVDETAIEACAKIGDMYATLSTSIPQTGGAWEYWAGEQDLNTFGSKICKFAEWMLITNALLEGTLSITTPSGIKINASGLNEELAEKAAKYGEYFADLADKIPETGYVQTLLGEKDLDLFGLDVCNFIRFMLIANGYLTGAIPIKNSNGDIANKPGSTFNIAKFKHAKDIGFLFVSLAQSIPKKGMYQNIFGSQELDEFGLDLAAYVGFLSEFNNVAKTNTWDIESARQVKDIGFLMVGLARSLQDNPGFSYLSSFADDMVGFVQTLSTIDESVGNSDYLTNKRTVEYLDNTISRLIDIAGKAASLRDKPIKKITDSVNNILSLTEDDKYKLLDTVGIKINAFSAYIPGFVENMSSIDKDKIQPAIDALDKFVELALKSNDIQENTFGNFVKAMNEVNTDAFSGFKDVFTEQTAPVVQSMKTFFGNITKQVPEQGKQYKEEYKNFIKEVLEYFSKDETKNNFKNAAMGLMREFRQGIYESVSLTTSVLGNHITSALKNAKENTESDFITLGENIVNEIIYGINNKIKDLTDAITTITNSIENIMRDNLKINSPSKVMAEIGSGIPEGLAVGMDNGMHYIKESIDDTSDYVITNTLKMSEGIRKALSEEDSVEPLISPAFDFSGFNRNRFRLVSDVDLNIRRPMSSLTNQISDAQAKIEASNNRVVDSINMLRHDVQELNNKEHETNLYVDSTKLASSIAKPMDRQLNILAGRRR